MQSQLHSNLEYRELLIPLGNQRLTAQSIDITLQNLTSDIRHRPPCLFLSYAHPSRHDLDIHLPRYELEYINCRSYKSHPKSLSFTSDAKILPVIREWRRWFLANLTLVVGTRGFLVWSDMSWLGGGLEELKGGG